jgi:hypothetical protein
MGGLQIFRDEDGRSRRDCMEDCKRRGRYVMVEVVIL